MGSVLSGFTVVWLVIVAGFLLGRTGVVSRDARMDLSRVAFFVASPCLLFTTVSDASIGEVLGPQFAIAAISAFTVVALFLLAARLLLRKRPVSELVVGAQSSSQVNAVNLGFPIAAFVLGDVAFAAPVVLFQLAIYMPLMVATLDQTTPPRQARSKVRSSTLRTVLRRVAKSILNPLIIGAVLGLLFSWQGWHLPEPAHESVALVAGAAIPLLLLVFGLSLVGTRPFEKASGRREDALMATVFKLVIHPCVAYLVATLLFDLEGLLLFAAVVMASLPTAQDVLTTAVRYQNGETVARDTVLITTVLGVPSLVFVAFLLR